MNKKAILAVIAVAGTVVGNAQVLKTNADSLGYYIGATQGVGFSQQSAQSVEPAKLDAYRAEFLKGLRQSMLSDTVNTGYRDGQRAGALMLDEIIRMRNAGMPVNLDKFCDAFAEHYTVTGLTEEEKTALFRQLSELLEPMQRYYEKKREDEIERQKNASREKAERNLAAGANFLKELKAKDKTVVTTPSGLVYKVNRKGEGPNVAPGGKAVVRYTGRLVDGTQFDSSGERTVTFGPGQVIKGFGEGLMLMNKGADYTLYIPSDLAYGMQAPPSIGPGQTLIFDVEVVDVLPE